MLGFATAALNARAIGAEGIGVIALFQSSALLMTGLFSFGTQQPLISLGKQALHDGDRKRLGGIASLAISLDYASSIAAGVVSLIIVSGFGEKLNLNAETVYNAQLYTAVVFLSGVSAANGVFRLFNCFHYFAFAQTWNAAALLGCSLVLFAVRAPLQWYLIAFGLINIVTAQAQVMLALRLMKANSVKFEMPLEVLRFGGLGREFLSYAWTTNLTGIINSARMNGESILLGAMFGSATVGVYNVVRQVAGVFNKLASVASNAIFPEIADLVAQRNYKLARQLLNRLAILGLALGLFGAFSFLVFGETVLKTAFGSEFSAGYNALVLLGFAGAITLSGATFGGFVQAFSSPVSLLKIYIVAFVIYAVAATFLIHQFGIIGASLAQISFSIAFWLGCWLLLQKILNAQRYVNE